MVKEYFSDKSVSTTLYIKYPNDKIVERIDSSEILVSIRKFLGDRVFYEETVLDDFGNEKTTMLINPTTNETQVKYRFENTYNANNQLITQAKHKLTNNSIEEKHYLAYDTLDYSKIRFVLDMNLDTIISLYYKNNKLIKTKAKSFDNFTDYYNEYDISGNLVFEDIKSERVRYYYYYKNDRVDNIKVYNVMNGKLYSQSPIKEIAFTYKLDEFNRPILTTKTHIDIVKKEKYKEFIKTKYYDWV